MASASEYALSNAWELAEMRLQSLEQGHDPVTTRRLRGLGVNRGCRCLELVAGRGSIARWLCDEVGAEGPVTAVDIDDRFLRQIDLPNLEVVRADVVTDPLPPGPFDLIHTRLLLMHLPARNEVLSRLPSLLRPGGAVLFEEYDVFPIMATADDAYGAAWSLFGHAMELAGAAPEWVRTLPARCVELGFVDVATDVDVPLFTAPSPEAEFWRLTWLQTADRMVAAGAPRHVIDAGIAALSQPGVWHYGPAMVAVSGRLTSADV